MQRLLYNCAIVAFCLLNAPSTSADDAETNPLRQFYDSNSADVRPSIVEAHEPVLRRAEEVRLAVLPVEVESVPATTAELPSAEIELSEPTPDEPSKASDQAEVRGSKSTEEIRAMIETVKASAGGDDCLLYTSPSPRD